MTTPRHLLCRAALAAALLLSAAPLARALEPQDLPASVRLNLAWQITLEHAGFSPGLVDGKAGPKTVLATQEFQKAHGLKPTGKLDDATTPLLLNPAPTLLTTYTLTDADESLVTGTPKDWNEKASMKLLGYASLAEAACERFHTSRKCLETLNPDLSLDRLKVGDTLTVPAIQEPDSLPRVARLEINLAEKAIRAFDRQDHEIALFHCSIAADVAKRPSGSARVVVVAPNPTYSFDPAMWPDVHNVDHKLLIPPGPRNPVGLCWIGLSLPGYGIHGTPNPEMIGKTGSHGCFRMTNWDAVRLGRITSAGIPVKFFSPSDLANGSHPTTPVPVAIAAPAPAPIASAPTPAASATPAPTPVASAAPTPSSSPEPSPTPALKSVSWEQLLMGTSPTTQPTASVTDSRDAH